MCTYTHARARVRASGFLFRKQNKVGSDTRKQNTGFPSLFRKLNSVGMKKRSTAFLGRCLKSGKRSRAPSLCIRTHARALAPFFSRFRFFYREKLFFLFFFLLYIFFLFVLYSKKSNFLFFLSFLKKSKY